MKHVAILSDLCVEGLFADLMQFIQQHGPIADLCSGNRAGQPVFLASTEPMTFEDIFSEDAGALVEKSIEETNRQHRFTHVLADVLTQRGKSKEQFSREMADGTISDEEVLSITRQAMHILYPDHW